MQTVAANEESRPKCGACSKAVIRARTEDGRLVQLEDLGELARNGRYAVVEDMAGGLPSAVRTRLGTRYRIHHCDLAVSK